MKTVVALSLQAARSRSLVRMAAVTETQRKVMLACREECGEQSPYEESAIPAPVTRKDYYVPSGPEIILADLAAFGRDVGKWGRGVWRALRGRPSTGDAADSAGDAAHSADSAGSADSADSADSAGSAGDGASAAPQS